MYTFDKILNDDAEFSSCLLHSLILFPKETEKHKYSGFITGALLHYFNDESVISIYTGKDSGWNTFTFTDKDQIKDFLKDGLIFSKDASKDEEAFYLK